MKNARDRFDNPLCPVCLEIIVPGKGGARPSDFIVHYCCWEEARELERSHEGYQEANPMVLAAASGRG